MEIHLILNNQETKYNKTAVDTVFQITKSGFSHLMLSNLKTMYRISHLKIREELLVLEKPPVICLFVLLLSKMDQCNWNQTKYRPTLLCITKTHSPTKKRLRWFNKQQRQGLWSYWYMNKTQWSGFHKSEVYHYCKYCQIYKLGVWLLSNYTNMQGNIWDLLQ